MMNLLGGPEMAKLKGAMSAAELRQQVIANNIANVDTPGFKRSEVLFEELLARRMEGVNKPAISARRTHAKHIPFGRNAGGLKPQLVTERTTSMNNNASNVDIDREMALLAKNQLRYNAYVRQLNHEISMMRIGIEGR